MPPKKRKAASSDSDDSDYHSPDSKPRSKPRSKASRKPKSTPKSTNTTGSLAPPSKRLSALTDAELSSYIAKTTADSPECTLVQTGPCQGYATTRRAKPWNVEMTEKCVTCIEKQSALGTCRFMGLRQFKLGSDGKIDTVHYAFGYTPMELLPKKQPKTVEKKKKNVKKVVEPSRRSGRKPAEKVDSEGPSTGTATPADGADDTPSTLSAKMQKEADYILPLIAPIFAEHLRREQHHENTHLGLPTEGKPLPGDPRPLFRIPSNPETRSLCDICVTSIYMGGYLCGCCGREMCLQCWEEWEPSAERGDRNRYRRIDNCSRRRRHERGSMLFMTRAAPGEMSEMLERVQKRVPSEATQLQEQGDADTATESIPTTQATWPNEELKYLPTPKTHHEAITLQQFRALWRRGGVPLVLSGFLPRFKLPWDPKYFVRKYGSEECMVHDCEWGAPGQSSVEKFFRDFVNTTQATKSLKLKDWPPSTDFASTFPELFRDFEGAIPFPEYISRSGHLNLAAHFPPAYVAPDLGPKMYNAYPAPDFLPSKSASKPMRDVMGTTNLHLDLTDAVNIMLFAGGGETAPSAATEPKDIPLCGAIWDIFPPSASVHLREYLNSPEYIAAHGAYMLDDPIHRQVYYLTEDDLAVLYKTKGVMSHRIYQDPGEAVFIPAGCAHQVRNRRSCVKVAVDFLTPENAKVCRGLIGEGRVMGDPFAGRQGAGKEDVLQLWSCLGFAWEVLDPYPKKAKHDFGKSVASGQNGNRNGVHNGEAIGTKEEPKEVRKVKEGQNGNAKNARVEIEAGPSSAPDGVPAQAPIPSQAPSVSADKELEGVEQAKD